MPSLIRNTSEKKSNMIGTLSVLAEDIWAIHTRVADASLPSLAALA